MCDECVCVHVCVHFNTCLQIVFILTLKQKNQDSLSLTFYFYP